MILFQTPNLRSILKQLVDEDPLVFISTWPPELFGTKANYDKAVSLVKKGCSATLIHEDGTREYSSDLKTILKHINYGGKVINFPLRDLLCPGCDDFDFFFVHTYDCYAGITNDWPTIESALNNGMICMPVYFHTIDDSIDLISALKGLNKKQAKKLLKDRYAPMKVPREVCFYATVDFWYTLFDLSKKR